MPRATRIAAALISALTIGACADPAISPTSPRLEPGSLWASNAPPSSSPNVVSTLYDADALGAALLTRSDDFNGSTSATYTAINNISSHIQADGSWQLYLGNQSVRTIRLTLASQGIPLPDGNYWQNVEVYTQCYDATNTQVSLLGMVAGAVNHNCSFGVDFSSGGRKYKLVMSPKWSGTGRAVVTCNSVSGTNCVNWTIATDTTVAYARVANLYQFGKFGALALVGPYHNSFSVGVAQ